jgi:uncharacterized protein
MHNPADIPPVIYEWQSETLTPVAPDERIEALDVLRGFALFGILTVNMTGFSWPFDQMMRQQFWETRADVVADWIVRFLAEGKFYPLFAFLFGLGAATQMERAESRGADFTGRFCRRLMVLFGIGLAHSLLLWEGDILLWYAACGFLLLPFRKRRPKTLLVWAALCLSMPALFTMLLWALLAGASLVPEIATSIQNALVQDPEMSAWQIEETIRVFSQGSYAEIFRARLSNLIYMWLVGIFYVPTFFAMFLLGLYAGRRRIPQDIAVNAARIRRVLYWGLIVGLPASLIYTVGMATSDLSDLRFIWLPSQVFVIVGGPAQGLAYAAAIALMFQQDWGKRFLCHFAAAGRMALSNYLFQSLVCTTIFYSYGLGLFGSVGRVAGLGLAATIYAAQVGLSIWWLNRFRFGPMEWLWRTLTYGRRQPMRR